MERYRKSTQKKSQRIGIFRSTEKNKSMAIMSSKILHNLRLLSSQKWKLLSFLLATTILVQVALWVQKSSSDCVHSFGTYKGHVYTAKETIGKPKCWLESKWMRIQQHSVSNDSIYLELLMIYSLT